MLSCLVASDYSVTEPSELTYVLHDVNLKSFIAHLSHATVKAVAQTDTLSSPLCGSTFMLRSRSESPSPGVVLAGRGRFMMDEKEEQQEYAMRSLHTSHVKDSTEIDQSSMTIPLIMPESSTTNTNFERCPWFKSQEDLLYEELSRHAHCGDAQRSDDSFLKVLGSQTRPNRRGPSRTSAEKSDTPIIESSSFPPQDNPTNNVGISILSLVDDGNSVDKWKVDNSHLKHLIDDVTSPNVVLREKGHHEQMKKTNEILDNLIKVYIDEPETKQMTFVETMWYDMPDIMEKRKEDDIIIVKDVESVNLIIVPPSKEKTINPKEDNCLITHQKNHIKDLTFVKTPSYEMADKQSNSLCKDVLKNFEDKNENSSMMISCMDTNEQQTTHVSALKTIDSKVIILLDMCDCCDKL